MATKSKLEQAVEERICSLNGAQRELVRSQLATYRRTAARIEQLESELAAVNSRGAATREEVRLKQQQRMAIACELNQLATANSKLASDLFDLVKE